MKPIILYKARWLSRGQVWMPTSKISIVRKNKPRYPRYLINPWITPTTKQKIIGRMREVVGRWRRRMPHFHRVNWAFYRYWKKIWNAFLRMHSVSTTHTTRSRASKPRRLTRARPQGSIPSMLSKIASSAPSVKLTLSRAACISCSAIFTR